MAHTASKSRNVIKFVPPEVGERITHWADRAPQDRVPELGPCLISRYSVASHGYAQIGWTHEGKYQATTAHRALWIAVKGPLPDGVTVDHLCHVRKCVEITHLRPLSNEDNAADNGQVKTNPTTTEVCGCGEFKTVGMVKGKPKTYCRSCQNRHRRARRALGKMN